MRRKGEEREIKGEEEAKKNRAVTESMEPTSPDLTKIALEKLSIYRTDSTPLRREMQGKNEGGLLRGFSPAVRKPPRPSTRRALHERVAAKIAGNIRFDAALRTPDPA